MATSPEIKAARQFTADAPSLLARSKAFQQLAPETQQGLLRDLQKIGRTLGTMQPASSDPYAFALDTPSDWSRHRRFPGQPDPAAGDGQAASGKAPESGTPTPATDSQGGAPNPRVAATQTLAARAGALSDEINFPAFVAALVHGTFDAIVDATIQQMEAFADLVSAVAKDVDQFTSENTTPNQARDWLAKQYPQDLQVKVDGDQPSLQARSKADSDEASPEWLSEFGLQGETLSPELIEEQLVPMARKRLGQNRLQTLATMVLLGMNRVVVRDGSVSARVRFRAQAQDQAKVDYATSLDPSGNSWGDRASSVYGQPTMMVSTVGVNVQADTELNAELFGEVRINFASETLPLEGFMDPARMALLQRNSRAANRSGAAPAAEAPPAAVPAVTLPAPVATTPPPTAAPPTATPGPGPGAAAAAGGKA